MRAEVFLCYARPDGKKMVQIYEKLQREGHKPWLDIKCLLPGEDWEQAIRKAIRKTDFVVVCLSKKSVDRRGFMQKEIHQALEIWKEKLGDDVYLIPARLEECVIGDEKLRTLHRVDIFKQNGFRQLLESIKKGMSRRYQ